MCLSQQVYAQNILAYSHSQNHGIILTQEYFGGDQHSFTPSKTDLDAIEELLSTLNIDFSGYVRQYYGETIPSRTCIYVQLIPMEFVKKYYPDWKEGLITVFDNTSIKYFSYDLKTKKLSQWYR